MIMYRYFKYFHHNEILSVCLINYINLSVLKAAIFTTSESLPAIFILPYSLNFKCYNKFAILND